MTLALFCATLAACSSSCTIDRDPSASKQMSSRVVIGSRLQARFRVSLLFYHLVKTKLTDFDAVGHSSSRPRRSTSRSKCPFPIQPKPWARATSAQRRSRCAHVSICNAIRLPSISTTSYQYRSSTHVRQHILRPFIQRTSLTSLRSLIDSRLTFTVLRQDQHSRAP